jgi:TetR/AcrR family transcriptional repressor of nem operon
MAKLLENFLIGVRALDPITYSGASFLLYSVLRERARKALRGWRSYVVSIISAGIKSREIRPKVDAKKLATLIICSLEGAIMLYRLERNEEALRAVQAHLDNYLESEVRVASK